MSDHVGRNCPVCGSGEEGCCVCDQMLRAEAAEARVRELEGAAQQLRDAHQAEVEKVARVREMAENWWNEAEHGEDERYGRIIARTLRSCADEVHELFGGCCTACKGEGYGYGGEPCWDCRGTGRPHPLRGES